MGDRKRGLLYRHVNLRRAVLMGIAVCACAVMTYTVHVLRSRTLVIKLHNSEERFVEEALHEIVLVPEKLAPPTETAEVPIEQRCEKLLKAQGRRCTGSRNAAKMSKKEEAETLHKKDFAVEEEEGGEGEERKEDGEGSLGDRVNAANAVLGRFELPAKEIWPARRREWREDEKIQRVSHLLDVNALYRRNIDLMHVVSYPGSCY